MSEQKDDTMMWVGVGVLIIIAFIVAYMSGRL